MSAKPGKRHPIKALIRKAGRIMAIGISILTVLVVIAAGILLAISPGKPDPIQDMDGASVPGSISEKIWVEINGVEQGMFIQSQDAANPVLLFVHGGPGMPEFFLTQRYPTGLENDFTVVWWDQRGAGLSYSAELDAETMTIEQMIADTLAVSNYLRERFNQDKIYLMGHSGGSFFGIQAAARAPELYHAYIGVGQMAFQLESEVLAYDYMLAAYRENGDRQMVKKLEAAKPTTTAPLPAAYARVRDAAMHGIGIGTTREMKSVISGIFLPSWTSRVYTVQEKLNLWRGKVFSADRLRDEMFAIDLRERVPALEVPVYFMMGAYDYTTSTSLARAYFEVLDAPVKGFYKFGESAHSPMFEEPERMREILREDVLTGTVSLADGR